MRTTRQAAEVPFDSGSDTESDAGNVTQRLHDIERRVDLLRQEAVALRQVSSDVIEALRLEYAALPKKIQQLQAEKASLASDLTASRQKILVVEKALKSSEAKLKMQDEKLRLLDAALKASERTLKSVFASRSWKYTAFLRGWRST